MEEQKRPLGDGKSALAAFLKRRGLYVVMGLCALCIGMAALAGLVKGTPPPPEATIAPPLQEANSGLSQTIGALATPAPSPLPASSARSECALAAHVHLAIYKDGTPVDPYTLVLLNK